MHMKQTIVVNKELNMSPGKLSAQVSHASMAFLTTMIQQGTNKILINGVHRYPCYTPDGKEQLYKRDDLWKWAEEARAQGKDHFYAKPVSLKNPCGELMLCEPEYGYQSTVYMDKDLYEGWIGGIFTKVCLEAKNENQMNKTVEKAKEAGLIEGRDFFCIRDACLTELTPDETGTRWTCIGFRPLPDEIINPITKKLQLYKG